jgi:uncharacterized membrane protein YhhN
MSMSTANEFGVPPITIAVGEAVKANDRLFEIAITTCFACVAALYILETVLDAKALRRPIPNALRFITKAGASLAFLVGAGNLMAATPLVENASLWMLCALAVCGAGDLFLVRGATFVIGVLTFLVGHCLFAISFLTYGIDFVSCLWALPVLGTLMLWAKWHLWPGVPKHMLPLIKLYSIAIFAMAILAAGTGRTDVFAAALLFIASDIGVSHGKFVCMSPLTRSSVFLYYAAQAIFAHTVSNRALPFSTWAARVSLPFLS